MSKELAYWVALSRIREIGPIRFFKLFTKYQNIEQVFNCTAEDLSELPLSPAVIEKILETRNKLEPEKELEKVLAAQIKPIPFFDEKYPEQLKHIYAPPYLLYALGNIELLKGWDQLAVVGTRQPSYYGLKMTALLTQELVQKGWGIVSGLAKGIDAKAHETALEAQGSTIAVLGCGVDIAYPYENRALYQQIKEKGLIISEMPLGTGPQTFLFPLRNRIITGLAKGTLVIEGDHKSGAMISAKLALDQNREVFALPGRVTDITSNGPNWLIQQGAKLVACTDDILADLGVEQKKSLPVAKKAISSPPKIQPAGLTDNEQKIYKELSDEEVRDIEYLSERTDIPITELMTTLSKMEIKGLIKQLSGKRFMLI